MTKTLTRGIFYIVAGILFIWTASLTYSFVYTVLPDAHFLVPLFALVVFDIGTLAWLRVFIDLAEGNGQRAISLGLCVFDMLGIGLIVFAEIFFGGQAFIAPPAYLAEWAVYAIAIWTIVNVAGVVGYHLMAPEARKKMAFQSQKDAVFSEALVQFERKRTAVSARLAEDIATTMLADMQRELDVENPKQLTSGRPPGAMTMGRPPGNAPMTRPGSPPTVSNNGPPTVARKVESVGTDEKIVVLDPTNPAMRGKPGTSQKQK